MAFGIPLLGWNVCLDPPRAPCASAAGLSFSAISANCGLLRAVVARRWVVARQRRKVAPSIRIGRRDADHCPPHLISGRIAQVLDRVRGAKKRPSNVPGRGGLG